jgi:hypothetical protein
MPEIGSSGLMSGEETGLTSPRQFFGLLRITF